MKNGSRQTRQFAASSRRSNGSRQASFTLRGSAYIPRRRRSRWLREKHPPAHRLCRGIVGTVTPQQHRFTGVVQLINPVTTRRLPGCCTSSCAATGKKVLHQPAVAQRVQRVKLAGIKPGRWQPLLIKHRRLRRADHTSPWPTTSAYTASLYRCRATPPGAQDR